jgi:hypothetical protein
MVELFLVLAIAAAVRGLVEQTRRDLAAWRNRPPPARGGGGVLRRVTAGGAGYWGHQAAHGFPTVRAGLHDGWMRAVEANHQARRQIAQARAEHAEGKTELLPELDEFRERRRAALAELERLQAERDRAAHEEWMERNRQALARDQERIRAEAEREALRWQARRAAEAQRELDRLRAERERAARSRSGRTFSCMCCGDDTGTWPLCGPCIAAGCEKSKALEGEVAYWNCQRGERDEPQDEKPADPGQQGPAGANRGDPPVETTYAGVKARMASATAAAEQRQAEAQTSETACEERVSEAESSKSWAATTADQMQALKVDAGTLDAMAEHLESLARAKEAEDAMLEAVQQARKAWGAVLESAKNVSWRLDASGHGGVQEARDNAAGGGAEKEFYGEGAA